MSKARILVVEDEVIVARDIRKQIEGLGYEAVGHTTHAEDSLELAGQLKPDLVLMDINLAGEMDGIEAAQIIRDRFAIPVVFLTAFNADEVLARAKQVEPYGYIIKPFTEPELRTTIEIALHRHQIDALLQQSEQRYRDLVDFSPDAIVVHAKGKLVFANPAAARLVGADSPEALIGRPILDFVHPDSQAAVSERSIAVYERRIVASLMEQKYLRLDGTVIDVEVMSVPTTFNAEPASQVMAHDITQRKRIEFQRENERRMLEMLALGEPIEVLLDGLARSYETMYPGTLCSVLLLDSDHQHLFTVASPSLPKAFCDAIDSVQIGPSAGSCGTAAHSGELVVVEDIATDPRWADYKDLALAHGLRACWSMPIKSSNRQVVGTLALYYRQPRSPQSGQIRDLGRAADLAGVAIERQLAQEHLKVSEQKFRLLYNDTPVMLHSADANGMIVGVSDYWLAKMGYRREEVLGRNEHDFLSERSREHALVVGRQRLRENGRIDGIEYQFIDRQGRVFDTLVSTVVEAGSQGGNSLSVVTDISERKLAEQDREYTITRQKRQAEVVAAIAGCAEVTEGEIEALAGKMTELIAKAMDVERVGIWFFTDDASRLQNVTTYVLSTGTHSVLGSLAESEFAAELASLKGSRYVDAHDALNDPRMAGYVEGYFKPFGITSALDTLIRVSGRDVGTLCIEHVNTSHRWRDDEIVFSCQLADQMTLALANRERRLAEASVHEAMESMAGIFNSSPDIQLISRLPSRQIIMVNDAFTERTGFTREEALGKTSLELGLWHYPAEFQEVAEALAEGEQVVNRELHLRMKGGELVIALLAIKAITLRGEPHLLVSGRDVTALRQTEAVQAFLAQYDLRAAGSEFFTATAIYLAELMQADHVLVLRLIDGGSRAQTDAFIVNGEPAENIVFDVPGTPCEEVFAKGNARYASGLAGRFPDDRRLPAWHAQAYAGIVLRSSLGHPIGAISVISSTPMHNAARIEDVMALMATRVASELERRMGDEALRASEQRTRQIVDTALDAVITMDMGGDITGWNPQAEKIFGWSAEEVLGSPLAEAIIPLPLRPRHHAGMQRFLSTGESQLLGKVVEITALRKDGSEFPVELTIAEAKVSGALQFSAFVRDITERKRTEAQLQSTLDDLAHRNRELQDFAFVASHDLQEPLRKIRAFSDRLLDRHAGQLDEQGREYLTRSDRAAERMQTLISDLLSYTRIGSRPATFDPIDLSQIVATVLEDLESSLESSAGRVDVDPLPIVEADQTQMRQLFQNLISNSLKFRDPARPPHVRVWAEPGNSKRELKILVEDNGIGFDDKYSEKIFAPFQRLHGRQQFEGTGIGLAIVRRIVERHHGNIRVTSSPGKGTRFELSLPRQQPGTDWQPPPGAAELGPGPSQR